MTQVTAKLIDYIDYKDGYVNNRTEIDEPIEIECELVESGCQGWGQANAIARKPGLLLDTSDAALWRELRSERFTTPLLKAWLPVIRKRLVDDELLTEPEQAGCKLGLLDAAPKQLDEIVSEGVKKGSMVIA